MIMSSQEEWVTMAEASKQLGVKSSKLSTMAGKGQIKTAKNALDARVTMVDLTELRRIFSNPIRRD